MNRQILAAFTILMFALAVAGYAYSHWQEEVRIQSTMETAKFGIHIKNHNAALNWQMSEDNHTLILSGAIAQNQPVLTEITIKNNGTTPASITCQIITNNSDLWDIYFIFNQNFTAPYELQAEDAVAIQHNITLGEMPLEPFAIEITIAYTAEFQSWKDNVTVTYMLTYQGES